MGQAQAGNSVVMAIRWVFDRSRADTAVGRHHTGIGREGKDSDVIVVGFAFILPLELVIFACFATIGQSVDCREPIGLQERLEGRSSHNGEFSVMSCESSKGNQGYASNLYAVFTQPPF